jgi:hypothetical protein
MKKDFRQKALQYEELRLKREMYNIMLDFSAGCATITLMMLLCYVIILFAH